MSALGFRRDHVRVPWRPCSGSDADPGRQRPFSAADWTLGNRAWGSAFGCELNRSMQDFLEDVCDVEELEDE